MAQRIRLDYLTGLALLHSWLPMRFLVGLIGSGIAASGSPAIHEREAQRLGIQLHYQLIDLRDAPGRLPEALDAAELIGFAGVNVTHPCKQAVIEYLDELTPDAEAIGAVNTVVFRNGKRTGHNTDWQGFRESFRRGLPEASLESVLVVGAGGGGSAVSYAALRMGARQVTVFDEMPERARSLAAKLGPPVTATMNLDQALREAGGIIHATPTGMTGHPGMPFEANHLRPSQWVADIVYFPLETELLNAAKERGCRTLDGGAMAVFQAAEAFRLFTGLEPDRERMSTQFRA